MNILQERMITKVAYLYYMEGKSQTEIAHELDIYRTTVGRMLHKAETEKIITFDIPDYDTKAFELENKLKEKYSLKEVIIIPNQKHQDEKNKDRALAEIAVLYLKKIIQPNDIVGVSWGKALEMLADGKRNIADLHACFVPLAGAPSEANSQYHVNSIVYALAQKFNSRSVFINTVAVQPDIFAAQRVYRTAAYKELQSYWQRMNVAVVGIGGSLNNRESSWRDLLSSEDVDNLKKEQAIGDCCCHFFNQAGKVVNQELERRLVAYPLEYLRQVNNVIGLARSLEKVPGIKVLLKLHLLNTLITDEETAQALIMERR